MTGVLQYAQAGIMESQPIEPLQIYINESHCKNAIREWGFKPLNYQLFLTHLGSLMNIQLIRFAPTDVLPRSLI